MDAQHVLAAMYTDTPLVFGHRGAKAYAPMNTLAAFRLAAEQGAHGIELDVHCTSDDALVVVHDFQVDATSNGYGRIAELTLAQLQQLDAGAWFAPQFAGEPIPTLDAVFAELGQRLYINVEIKVEPQADAHAAHIAALVATCIDRHAMQQRVLISSFHPPTLVRCRELMPHVPLGYLHEQRTPTLPNDAPYEAYHPHYTLVTPDLLVQCQQRGLRVNVWTVNDPVQAVALRDMGVDGIISDNPDTVLAALPG